MIRQYAEEFAFWWLLFAAFFLMFLGFKPLFKVAIAHLPAPAGAKETIAA